MADNPVPPLNTREFVTRWSSAVEEHLVTELTDILHRLAPAGPGGDLSPEQCSALARHFAHALRESGVEGGGIHAAMQYLHEVAVAGEQPPETR
jgi:hypothetical protein